MGDMEREKWLNLQEYIPSSKHCMELDQTKYGRDYLKIK
jgi:hypothetical protein